MRNELQTMLAAAVTALAITIIAILLTSCKTIEVVKYVDREVVKKELQRDSVWLHDSIYVDRYTVGDTIWLNTKTWKTKYIERVRYDTCYITKDSVIVEYITTNKLNAAQRGMIRGFWILLAAIIGIIVIFVGKRFGWWNKIKALIKIL